MATHPRRGEPSKDLESRLAPERARERVRVSQSEPDFASVMQSESQSARESARGSQREQIAVVH